MRSEGSRKRAKMSNMKAGASGGKRSSPEDSSTIPLCVSIQLNGERKISNRIYSFDSDDTWKQILTEVALEMDKTDMSRLKTATRGEISVQLSSKLHGSEIFYPDIEEEIKVVRQFDKSLKYVTYKINSNTVDPVPPQRANALHHIMQTQTLCTKSAPKKDTNEKKFTGVYIA